MLITERIHALKIPFQIKLPSGMVLDRFVYLYLIYGDKVYLIDTGVASGINTIFDYIKKTDRKLDDISLIILTHSHPDHIGSASIIKEKTGCKIAAHSAEKNWIEDVELQAKERPIPGFQFLVDGSVQIDNLLNDGDIIKLEDGIELEVLHTPGHSRGSISLLYRDEMTLFSGDSVFIPGDIPIYEDALLSANTIKKLKEIKELRFLLSSWDAPRKDSEIYETMDKGLAYLQRIHDIVRKVSSGNDMMELCKSVVFELKLPQSAINPLVAKSLQSNLKAAGKSLL